MALHYHLENNELGLCLACGLMIEGGESGCIAYTNDALTELKARGIDEAILDLFFIGYQLQHYEYYDVKDVTAVSFLLTIAKYLTQNKIDNFAKSKKKITSFLHENFFYLRQILSTVFIAELLNETDSRMCEKLLHQYLTDIWNTYEEYQEQLIERI